MPVRVALLVALVSATIHAADLRLAQSFQDHAVLQTGMPVPVWGWAEAGATVTVAFAGQTVSATAGGSGRWQATLAPLAVATTPGDLVVTSGGQTLTCGDVLVGEVWLCAGQSNMARSFDNEAAEYPQLKERQGTTDLPLLRAFRLPAYASATPRDDIDAATQGSATWTVCTAQTAGSIFASPFFFAQRLIAERGVPVGLVQVAVSGTNQTAWCAPEVLDTLAAAGVGPSYDQAFTQAEAGLVRSKTPFTTWEAFAKVDADWHADPQERWPGGLPACQFPGVLFHAQILPLAPLAFRGALWNQGEAGPANGYARRLHAMIQDWRARFGHDFHFIFSSLGRGSSTPPPLEPVLGSFYRSAVTHQLGEAQQLFGDSGTWVDIADLGNCETHWGRKDAAGQRYANAALTRVYGTPADFSGPLLEEVVTAPGRWTLRFARSGGGLRYAAALGGATGFVLQQGDESRWIAPVEVTADTLVFADEALDHPTTIIAYGRHPNPHEAFFGGSGLPASAFVAGEAAPRLGKDPAPWIRLVDGGKAKLHVAEVRATYVVVSAIQLRGTGTVHVEMTPQAGWDGLAVRDAHGDRVDVFATAGGNEPSKIRIALTVGGPAVVIASGDLDEATWALALAAAKERF